MDTNTEIVVNYTLNGLVPGPRLFEESGNYTCSTGVAYSTFNNYM